MAKKNHQRKRRFNWNKFTDLRSRNYRDDLEKLCASFRDSEVKFMFNKPDETGLYPIHWASIHNRDDLIDMMIEKGSPIRVKCFNRLFANGTELHLAAMNGSVEAASMLLKAEKDRARNGHGFKTIEFSDKEEANKTDHQSPTDSGPWVNERDIDDQTPLMRTAAPRSKRLSTIRDLLRKNLWSMSSRPSEVALLLISAGGNINLREKHNGMNLMHLAIVNDYDDIVALIINLCPEMANSLVGNESERTQNTKKSLAKSIDQSGLVTVDLGSSKESVKVEEKQVDSTEESSDTQMTPLLRAQYRAEKVISDGLDPLKLAILYGRSRIIKLLTDNNNELKDIKPDQIKRALRNSIISNFIELRRFVKGSILKYAFALDMMIFGSLWLPILLFASKKILGGAWGMATTLCYLIVAVLALRVALNDPGFLRKDTSEYKQELRYIVASSDEERREKQTREIEKDEANKIEERIRLLCHKCRCIRKPRSRHCDYCDGCIQDFDHHCIYLGCCIGKKNRLDFLVMSFFIAWFGLYGTAFVISTKQSLNSFCSIFCLIWVIKYLISGCVTAFFTLRRAFLGVTMYESIRSKRIRKIFGPNGPPKTLVKANSLYSVARDAFWRYSQDSFRSGDLPGWKIKRNLNEFANRISIGDYLKSLIKLDKTYSTMYGRRLKPINRKHYKIIK